MVSIPSSSFLIQPTNLISTQLEHKFDLLNNNMTILYSLIESSMHPDFSKLYKNLGIREFRYNSSRKAISHLKKEPPDYLVAEFFYGYGTNYAGINISNLDVFLFSLQKYAPEAKIIVMVDKKERQYVDKLNDILPLHAVLLNPVREAQIQALLDN